MRTNYTLAEPDGTTTKLNEPGAALDDATRAALAAALLHGTPPARAGWCSPARCRRARRSSWYADLVRALRGTGARIAVDTSEEPLRALLAAGPDAAPDLLKPNAEELAQLAGVAEADVTRRPRRRRWPPSARCTSAAWPRCC